MILLHYKYRYVHDATDFNPWNTPWAFTSCTDDKILFWPNGIQHFQIHPLITPTKTSLQIKLCSGSSVLQLCHVGDDIVSFHFLDTNGSHLKCSPFLSAQQVKEFFKLVEHHCSLCLLSALYGREICLISVHFSHSTLWIQRSECGKMSGHDFLSLRSVKLSSRQTGQAASHI